MIVTKYVPEFNVFYSAAKSKSVYCMLYPLTFPRFQIYVCRPVVQFEDAYVIIKPNISCF
jgi:hypothetical protein